MLHFVTSYINQIKKNLNKLPRVRSTDWKSSLNRDTKLNAI